MNNIPTVDTTKASRLTNGSVVGTSTSEPVNTTPLAKQTYHSTEEEKRSSTPKKELVCHSREQEPSGGIEPKTIKIDISLPQNKSQLKHLCKKASEKGYKKVIVCHNNADAGMKINITNEGIYLIHYLELIYDEDLLSISLTFTVQ